MRAKATKIADWLEKLGMSEYADRFAENDVDTSVLSHLTDQDLKELGVSLGHRRKMLAAIAELPSTISSKPEPVGSPEPKPQETAERRQVTVMFSDLVGSTALSARMDPEDLREVISAYQMCVAETVQRFGGFVAKYMAVPLILCGHYSRASAQLQELGALAEKRAAPFWTIFRTLTQGFLFAVAGRPSNAVEMITSGIAALRATGYTHTMPWWLSHLAVAHVDLDQLDDAQHCIGEALDAIEKTKERWCEAEAYRLGGGIALKAAQPDVGKAQAYFDRALAIARQQQAKSWELRAAMSLARLWRDQGKVQQARELLAPVYGWFTEGFDTRDLKEAKALLEELAT